MADMDALDGALPDRTRAEPGMAHAPLPWCGVLAALAILAGIGDAALVDVVTGSGERWRVGSAQVAASAATPRPPNSGEELASPPFTRHAAAAAVVVTLTFRNSDGSTGNRTSQSTNHRVAADTHLFSTEAQALGVYAHLCTDAR